MDLLKDLFGIGADDEPAAPAAASEAAATEADPEKAAARDAKRQEKRAERQAARQAKQEEAGRTDKKAAAATATAAKRTDFADRYQTGHPAEGITAEEALEHLEALQGELTPAEFRKAMAQALDNLPESERDEFVALMRKNQAEAAAADSAVTDPLTGLLGGLMGGGPAGAANVPSLSDILNDLRQGGLNAPAHEAGKQPTEQDFLNLINSPLGRAVLGGVAAYGMQQSAGKKAAE